MGDSLQPGVLGEVRHLGHVATQHLGGRDGVSQRRGYTKAHQVVAQTQHPSIGIFGSHQEQGLGQQPAQGQVGSDSAAYKTGAASDE